MCDMNSDNFDRLKIKAGRRYNNEKYMSQMKNVAADLTKFIKTTTHNIIS
jgi:hypothetical protein